MCGSTKRLCQVEKGGKRESEHGLAVAHSCVKGNGVYVQDLEGLDRTRNLLGGQGTFNEAHSQTHTHLGDPSPSCFFMFHSLEDPDSRPPGLTLGSML